ncbi:MAG: diacylglycerol kinase [Flavobacteriales bacterium]|jgi:YegS/Rv2252/BmrU family lipid kinase|nr:diacylglycerol kinase [Flavobacteriales bacterium]|tara:strand:- start:35135 stop:36007 length:873 start_codon:yes stop_codon:yes gene_type:complete
MSKTKVLFIINPISGTGKQKIVEKLLEKHLDTQYIEYDITYTERAKHAIEIAKKAKDKYDIITAVGGDGSVNEVGSQLIGSNTTLAIIPVGSGNGLARHLKIPLTIKNAIETINNLKKTTIDVVKINDGYFLGTAGSGFDARIGWLFSQAKKRGFWTYFKITVKEYFNYNEGIYDITIDGKKFNTKALLITFANSNQYGNNAYISPNSKLDDGLIRIIILKKFPLLYSLNFAYKLFNKKINTFRYINELKGKNITIIPPEKELHIDGEPVLTENEINLSIQPLSLKIITP